MEEGAKRNYRTLNNEMTMRGPCYSREQEMKTFFMVTLPSISDLI